MTTPIIRPPFLCIVWGPGAPLQVLQVLQVPFWTRTECLVLLRVRIRGTTPHPRLYTARFRLAYYVTGARASDALTLK